MLTETTTDITMTLCNSVRALTTDHLATHWFSHLKRPKESARRAARKLVAEGFAKTRTAMVTPVDVSSPLLCWAPTTDSRPNFKSIAATNQARWKQPPKSTTVLTPTAKALGRFGGCQRVIRERELEHDCTVANVFLSLSEKERENWVLEDALDEQVYRHRRPDAVVCGNPSVIVDVIGRGYGEAKLRDLWEAFNGSQLEFR